MRRHAKLETQKVFCCLAVILQFKLKVFGTENASVTQVYGERCFSSVKLQNYFILLKDRVILSHWLRKKE